MTRRASSHRAPPPILQQGYAVFVKLWDISAMISADLASSLFNCLDDLLLGYARNDMDNWFPSPYGGAIVVSDAERALLNAKAIIQETATKGISVSVGIAYGTFERVHNVTRWNTAALAMNVAARMASNELEKGRIAVEPNVRNDIVSIRRDYETIFGALQKARVKRTNIQYHAIVDEDYIQRLAPLSHIRSTRKKSRFADVVLLDIHRYSEKSSYEQARVVEHLSRCVELALICVGVKPTHFGPAGDGGYLAFVLDGSGSANTAWPFAKNLREQARRENIAIRIGIANGPIFSSATRSIIGSVVAKADNAASLAPTGEIAVTPSFWNCLVDELRFDWEVASEEKDSSILVLCQKFQSVDVATIKNLLTDRPILSKQKLRVLRRRILEHWPIPLIVILLFAVLLVARFVIPITRKPSSSSTSTSQSQDIGLNSIAVLPFFIEGQDVQEFLSEGLANELNARLRRLRGLRVIPISSVLRYKGKIADSREVGRELGVEAVIAGRLERHENYLIIKIELVDLRTGEPHQKKFEQIEQSLSVPVVSQELIATKIVRALELNLSGEDRRGLNKRFTDNDEANEFYMKGRFFLAMRTRESLQHAVECFEAAVRFDKTYALAYVGLAEAHNIMAGLFFPTNDAIEKAKTAALQAKSIDSTLADARTALGTSFAMQRKWAESEFEFREGLRLDPKSSGQHWRYALYYLIPMGRTSEAVQELKTAFDLDPDSLIVKANGAAMQMFDRKNDVALNQVTPIVEEHPEFLSGRFILAIIHNASRRYEKAIALSERTLKEHPTNQLFLYTAGYAYAKLGRKGKAKEILRTFERIEQQNIVSHYFIASIYVGLGQPDEAFAELRKALLQNDFYLLRLKVDPLMEPIQTDERFGELVKDMGVAS